MPHRLFAACAAVALAVPAVAGSSPLVVANRILVERRVAAADGTTRIVAGARDRAVPGDRLIVELSYRNTGARPIADLVLADPVPAELAYRAPAAGSASPEVSIDGSRFAPLAEPLTVALPGGGQRPAIADDVVAVRWRLAAPLAPGAGGTLSFRAVLR